MPNELQRKRVTQIGFLVRDAEAAAKEWAKFPQIEVPPVTMCEAYEVTHATYEGKPCYGRIRQVIIDVDNIQLEFIEPVGDEPSFWYDSLRKQGEGLHHIAFSTGDMDGSLKTMDQEGFRLIQRGSWPDTPRDGQYAYLDTMDRLKCCIELLFH